MNETEKKKMLVMDKYQIKIDHFSCDGCCTDKDDMSNYKFLNEQKFDEYLKEDVINEIKVIEYGNECLGIRKKDYFSAILYAYDKDGRHYLDMIEIYKVEQTEIDPEDFGF